jgi:hypothetical protein
LILLNCKNRKLNSNFNIYSSFSPLIDAINKNDED